MSWLVQMAVGLGILGWVALSAWAVIVTYRVGAQKNLLDATFVVRLTYWYGVWVIATLMALGPITAAILFGRLALGG